MNNLYIYHEITMNSAARWAPCHAPQALKNRTRNGNLSAMDPFHGCKGGRLPHSGGFKDMTKIALSRAVLGFLTLSLVGALCVPAAMARGKVHLRVEVTNEDSGEMKINLDMPLTAIESILEVLNDQVDGNFDMDFGHHGMDVRRIYMALRDEEEADFLEVNDGDEHVRIWKDRDAFHVRVTRDGDSRPTVMIYLPLQVLDALFSGPEDSMPDLKVALRELEDMAPLTLVEVYDDHETVKIWLE